MKPTIDVLVVDDDDRLRERMLQALTARGQAARGAASLAEARALLEEVAPRAALLDLRLDDGLGTALIDELVGAGARVVMLTGFGSIPVAVDAVRRGAVDFLQKPIEVEAVLRALRGEAVSTTEAEGAPAPSLARAEWEHIQRVLDDCEGNITRAAERLGVHRRTLQRKLKERPPRR